MESHDLGRQQRPRNWRNWALGIAVILAIIFVAENSQRVSVTFLFVDTTANPDDHDGAHRRMAAALDTAYRRVRELQETARDGRSRGRAGRC